MQTDDRVFLFYPSHDTIVFLYDEKEKVFVCQSVGRGALLFKANEQDFLSLAMVMFNLAKKITMVESCPCCGKGVHNG